MNAQDGRAMFELQLELHTRAIGRRPNITADDVLDVMKCWRPTAAI
jgi:hypothetical protein